MYLKQAHKLWKIKTSSSFGIHKTIHYNDSYLLLFGKKKWKNDEVLKLHRVITVILK